MAFRYETKVRVSTYLAVESECFDKVTHQRASQHVGAVLLSSVQQLASSNYLSLLKRGQNISLVNVEDLESSAHLPLMG